MTAQPPTPATPEEYVTDVPYLRNFVDDLGPSRLRLAAALNGFAPPPATDFDYCELGSGTGDTTVTLAAAYPGARFVGVDVNPEHVTFARSMASRAGLANVRFLERDFEGLLDGGEALPAFDYLGAHGVLSWVSAAKRKAVIALAAAKLKPGGLFYVSYNALPGWAAIEPLRRLMVDSAGGVPGTSLDRARHGLALAKLLNDTGAEYFTSNPTARSMLETMRKSGLPYVVHEYLHAHWSPMYFADVAREMAAADLYFIGQIPLHLNYRDLSLPPALVSLFKGVDNRVAFETLKDFALNEFFRSDVYIKGQAPCSAEQTRAYFDATPFGAPAGASLVLRELRLPHYQLQFAGPVFDALIPALAEGAATVPELCRRPALAGYGAEKIREALMRLVLGEQVLPMTRSAPFAAVAGAGASAGRYRVPLAHNRMMLEQRLASANLIALASPLAGTGIALTTLQATALHLLTAVEPAERDAWLRAFVGSEALELHDGDRRVTDPDERRRILAQKVEEFRVKRVPELVRLGILEEG